MNTELQQSNSTITLHHSHSWFHLLLSCKGQALDALSQKGTTVSETQTKHNLQHKPNQTTTSICKTKTWLTDMMNQHVSHTCCLFPILILFILLYPTKQNILLLFTTFFP